MFLLKACPKCRGDLVIEAANLDRWGEPADILCIQCGRTAAPPERDAMLRHLRLAMRRRQSEPVPARTREIVHGRYS